MDIFFQIVIVIAGLCWGSFLNVLIVRTENNENIIFPPSKCPKCGNKLYWWHNIPLLSYLLLKGKCYFCNRSINIRYPVIELLGMIIVLFSFNKYLSLFDAISVAYILSMFLVLSFTDFDIKKVSIFHVCSIIVAGLIFNRYNLPNSVLGCCVSAGLIALLLYIGKVVFKKNIFGAGDIFLFGALGSVVGYDKLFFFMLCVLGLQFISVIPSYVLDLIKYKQVETLKYLIIYFITCLFLYVSKNINLKGANIVLSLFLLIMLFSGFKIVMNLIKNIKNAEVSTYCQLSASVAITCLIFLS